MKYVNHFDGEVRIRKSLREDATYLSQNLRDEDQQELKLMGIIETEKTILFGFEAPESICYTMEYKDKIVAMFGCVPVSDEDEFKAATLWMLSTDGVKLFPRRFVRLAHRYVKMFMEEFDTLMNFIHPANTLSMKLVRGLKAEFKEGFRSPVTGESFVLFLI